MWIPIRYLPCWAPEPPLWALWLVLLWGCARVSRVGIKLNKGLSKVSGRLSEVGGKRSEYCGPPWPTCPPIRQKKSCVAPPTLAIAPLDAPIATARGIGGGTLNLGPCLVYIVGRPI